jgi:single-strand DNA-binding protein
MNQVNIIGALTKDPETRTITTRRTQTERTVLDTRIVVPRGGQNDPKDYFPVTFYGKDAETVAKYSAAGRRLGITGRLELQQWGEGDERQSRVAIIAESVKIIDWPPRGNDDSAPAASAEEKPATDTLVDTADLAPSAYSEAVA